MTSYFNFFILTILISTLNIKIIKIIINNAKIKITNVINVFQIMKNVDSITIVIFFDIKDKIINNGDSFIEFEKFKIFF